MPQETLGRYVLEELLARGGMAEVHLARQSGPGGFEKRCVVKRMLQPLAEDAQFVQMFFDEARLAAQLDHPNIAQIFDFGESSGTYYLAMEYVPGANLRAVVKDHARSARSIPWGHAARLVAQAAAALDYAHNAKAADGRPLQLIHRDVSPQNILLSEQGAVKLIDFGVAKAATARARTATGMIKGKIAYMSPEQLRDEPLDPRSDVYGLGLVLYELLAHRRAIPGTTDAEILKAAMKRAFEPLPQVRPGLPPDLYVLVDRALAKAREDRHASAGALASDLEALLSREGLSPSAPELAALLPGAPPPLPAAEVFDNAAVPTVVDPDFSPALPQRTTRRERPLPGKDQASDSAVSTAPGPVPSGVRAGLFSSGRPGWLGAALLTAAVLAGLAATLAALLPGTTQEAPGLPPTATVPAPLADPAPVSPKPPRRTEVAVTTPLTTRPPRAVEPGLRPRVPGQERALPATLHLVSSPVADVSVDGVARGRTPLTLEVSSGDHTLTFRDDARGLTHSRRVRLAAGETRREAWRARRGTVSFRAVPYAEVFLGEERLGLTPLTPVELYEGSYRFRFRNPETGRAEARVVEVSPGKETVVKVDLRER